MSIKLYVEEKIEKTYRTVLEKGGTIEVKTAYSNGNDRRPKGTPIIELTGRHIAYIVAETIVDALQQAKRSLEYAMSLDNRRGRKAYKESKQKELDEINRALSGEESELMKIYDIKLERRVVQTTTRRVFAENLKDAIEKAKHHSDERAHKMGKFGSSLVMPPDWKTTLQERIHAYDIAERNPTKEELRMAGLSENALSSAEHAERSSSD